MAKNADLGNFLHLDDLHFCKKTSFYNVTRQQCGRNVHNVIFLLIKLIQYQIGKTQLFHFKFHGLNGEKAMFKNLLW